MITNLTCTQCKSKQNLSHKKVTTFSRVKKTKIFLFQQLNSYFLFV